MCGGAYVLRFGVDLGGRDDIRAEECTTAQLKYKAESEARAA
jgi:hypothetical protein